MRMKHIISLCVAFAILFFAGKANAQDNEDDSNPIYQSSVEWLRSSAPLENASADSEKEMKKYEERVLVPNEPGGRKFTMIPIPGGKFTMGSPATEKGHKDVESPQFEVEVRPFWMGETEVTWREFELYALKQLRELRKDAPPSLAKYSKRLELVDAFAAPTDPYNLPAISFGRADDPDRYPASGMTQFGAQAYCMWLTAATGRYYRLPTEAEWEYACRAGTKTAFSFGDDENAIDEYAWTAKNCEPGTGYHPVKQKKPNAFGLYDMHGNVAEWTCQQYRKKDYQEFAEGEIKDAFLSFSQKARFGMRGGVQFGGVVRGGSCDHAPEDCRSASRQFSDKEWHKQDAAFPTGIWWTTDAPYVGFRVVRPLEPPQTEDEAGLYDLNPEVWRKYRELNQRE